MEKTMSRRAALGALASTAAVVVPFASAAANAAEPQAAEPLAISIEELSDQFRDAAMKLDPRITECWVGYDERTDGPRDMRVMSVYFGRKDTPFVSPPRPRQLTITELYEQWHSERTNIPTEPEAEGSARYDRYIALQDKITSMRPRSAREMAMQLVVETDDGESDYRPEFFDRLRLMALGV